MLNLVADLIEAENIKGLDRSEKIRLLPIYKSLRFNEFQILARFKDKKKALVRSN